METVNPLNIDTKKLLPVLTNQKGLKSTRSKFLTTNSYPHQK